MLEAQFTCTWPLYLITGVDEATLTTGFVRIRQELDVGGHRGCRRRTCASWIVKSDRGRSDETGQNLKLGGKDMGVLSEARHSFR